ncbi:MAG: translation initiation factor IF-2 [Bacteroidota bacterium]
MAKDKKITRLSKVAREFNVGISTIVDFLHKKGYGIDSNPNAKVSPEQYNLLVDEYSTDSDVKKQSQKINLDKSHESSKHSISINDIEQETQEDDTNSEESGDDEEIFIKDVSGKEQKKSAQKPKEKETSKEESEKEKAAKEEKAEKARKEKEKQEKEPKVVGKIDLDSVTKKQKAEKEEDKSQKKQQETPEKTEKKEKSKQPSTKETEKKTSKKEETKAPKKSETVKKEEEKDKKAKKQAKTEKQETEEAKKEEKTDEKVKKTEKPAEETPENVAVGQKNTIDIKDEEEKEQIKVVGKIDLDSLNQKTRPDRKTRKEKEAERTKKEGTKKEGAKKESAKKEEEKSTDESTKPKRKRRKRINKDKEKVQVDNKTKQQEGTKEKKEPPKKKKSKKKRPVRNEVDEEDVQKQVKETLSRLTSKGKSKGSKYRREKRQAINEKQQEEAAKQEEEKNVLKVTEFVSVNELASMMEVPVNDVIQTCMNLGLLVSMNQRLDAETMALVADEYNYKVEFVSVEVQEAIKDEEDREEDLEPRDPIVTVMGHVDHGKTSLLDHIRKANVIAGEAGGITQHIGAYRVEVTDEKRITFLDTPGHEAFTAMRARGAQITDVAIIVVAADDNVMPQTIEAINHASAAGVPIVFAINKVDKPGASPERIKEELANMNYLVEEWGGKYQSQDISAKKGENIEALLEKVLLESELLDLKANPNKNAIGTVLESWLDKGRGYVSNILVQAGKMIISDVILAGSHMGRAKAMFNERGKEIKEVGPSQPVQLLGLSGAPQAGDKFNVMDTEKEAKEIANKRSQLEREQTMRTQKHITLDEIGRRIAIGNFKEVNLVVKGDVDGSVEALSDAFAKLSTEEIQINIIHKGVGQITESDILLAAASNAVVIGFQVRPSASARKLAAKEQIDIRLYSIIYDAINNMKDALEGMLEPEIKEEITGNAEVKDIFKIKKVGTIAGCIVKDGKLERDSKVRVIRDGIVIHSGELESLKRFKQDAKVVTSGYECGLNVKNYNDIEVGDVIEGYKEVEVKKSLEDSKKKK